MLQLLYTLIIYPVRLIIEFVYAFSNYVTENAGISIVCVSIAVSVLCLPLYMRAEAMQEEERNKEKMMAPFVKHLKKTFKNDEQYFMINEYYRISSYTPLMVLRSSFSLLIQIPFFMAAYIFLSQLGSLKGSSFLFIKDLGVPDALLPLWGGVSLNILPVAMTLINCISGAVYTKGFPVKEKVQLYGMALIFLVLLYNSPSGLVLYWTFNNIFSLCKNIIYKMKRPKLFITLSVLLAGLSAVFYMLVLRPDYPTIKPAVIVSALSVMPLFFFYIKPRLPDFSSVFHIKFDNAADKKNFLLFIFSCLLLSLMTGFLAPSAAMSSDPSQFVNINDFADPSHLVYRSLTIAVGFFTLWPVVIYLLLDDKKKEVCTLIFFVTSTCAVVTYFFFGKSLGILTPLLKFETGINYSLFEKLVNLAVLLFVIFVLSFVFYKIKFPVHTIMIALALAVLSLSVFNMHKTEASLADLKRKYNISDVPDDGSLSIEPILHLSRKGQNIIVFMLDRAIGGFVPELVREKPELKKQFSGFTYYPNTISFGLCTVYGAPALFGGYEYTPYEINKRTDESLKKKIEESMTMLPSLFNDLDGWKITVNNLPFADLDIFDKYSDVSAYSTKGAFTRRYKKEAELPYVDLEEDKRNFFIYGIFKCIPVIFQNILYRNGSYWNPNSTLSFSNDFVNDYAELYYLKDMTVIEEEGNNLIEMDNDTPHRPSVLQLPDYVPAVEVNNYPYRDSSKYFGDLQYNVNMASLIKLGEWFDYLKQEGVYDNTRIIVVSDHGSWITTYSENFTLENWPWMLRPENFNCLLMVKDFYSEGDMKSDNTFMTNADVASIVVSDVIGGAENPFTKKTISNDYKFTYDMLIADSGNHSIEMNNPNTFKVSSSWLSVHDDIFTEGNWTVLGKDVDEKVKDGKIQW